MNVSFANDFEQQKLTIFQFPQQILDELNLNNPVKIQAEDINGDCYLISNNSLHKLRRTVNQSLYLFAQQEEDAIKIKTKTQTVMVSEKTYPPYEQIYQEIQENYALKSLEQDLEVSYQEGKLFDQSFFQKYMICQSQIFQVGSLEFNPKFLDQYHCLSYKDKCYCLSESVKIDVFQLLVYEIQQRNKINQEFDLKQLFSDELMIKYVTVAISEFCNGIPKITTESICQFCIRSLFQEKSEYLFNEFYNAFWEYLLKFIDTEQIQEKEKYFYEISKKCVYCEFGRKEIIVRYLDQKLLSIDPLLKAKQLTEKQKQWPQDLLKEWLTIDLINKKFKQTTINDLRFKQVYPNYGDVTQFKIYIPK